MVEMGLHAYRRKLRYHSYKGEVGRIAPNILQRDFEVMLQIASGRQMLHKWIYRARNATYLLY